LPPNSDRTALIALARAAATQHSLNPALICAIVERESAWDRTPSATNPPSARAMSRRSACRQRKK